MYSSLGMLRSSLMMAVCRSATVLNLCPLILDFNLGKAQKSHGDKSGL